MKQLLVFILIITTFFSCKPTENSCGQAYVGGEIINPNTNYLTLYKDTELIDTLHLDKNNRFSYRIESLNPGLFTFIHGGEAQFAIIEPSDSLMIRLNTFDFDESLVFSGKGSKKNNYLINLYLSLEEEDRKISRLSHLKPELFLSKLDSMKMESYNSLNAFNERYTTTNLFNKISKLSIDFSYYKRKELYPLKHFGLNTSINLDSLPQGYYNFRKNIDYNDEELTEFFPFYNFLFAHFNNLASEKYFKITNKTYINRKNVQYNLNKLDLIDSLVQSKEIKNILLKLSTRNILSNSISFEDSEAIYKSFMDKNTDKYNSEYITRLYSTIKRLQPGNLLPEVEVLNHRNESSTLNNITRKPTVLYFWTSANQYHFKSSHRKVKELQKNYPNIDFISININSNNTSVWKRQLKQNRFNVKQEYRFRNPQVANKLLAIKYISKVIIVDQNNIIVSSNANMLNRNFIELLNQLK